MVQVSDLPFREESILRALARKEEFIRKLIAVGPPPPVTVELEGEALLSYREIKRVMTAPVLPLHQITSRAQAEWDAAGLYGLALADLPAQVHAFVRVVAEVMEVRPGTGFLFVVPHTHCGLPEGAYGLASEGAHQSPFGWWLDMAVLDGRVLVPDGWRVEAVESAIAGIYPA